jgi:hypothetical protein
VQRLMTAVCAAAVLACGSAGPSSPNTASAVGVWSVSQVNGSTLPYVVSGAGANRAELTALAFTIADGGGFTSTASYRTFVNNQPTTSQVTGTGTWVQQGSSLTLHVTSDGSTASGAIAGDSLTLVAVAGASTATFTLTRH